MTNFPTLPPSTSPDTVIWRVRQFVYNPDGSWVGLLRQRRQTFGLSDGRLMVQQHTLAEQDLGEHPTTQLLGQHEYAVESNDRLRRYVGPAVEGSGLTWGPGVATGRGWWPQQGLTFDSFSVSVRQNYQINGGTFSQAGLPFALVVGLAQPESDPDSPDWPQLSGSQWAAEVSPRWQGTWRVAHADGLVEPDKVVERHYTSIADWHDTTVDDSYPFHPKPQGNHWLVSGSANGLARRFGWVWHMQLHPDPQVTVDVFEVLDPAGPLISMRRWLQDENLVKVEVLRLHAAS